MKKEKETFLVNLSRRTIRKNLSDVLNLYSNKIDEEFKKLKTNFKIDCSNIRIVEENGFKKYKMEFLNGLIESDFTNLFDFLKYRSKMNYEAFILTRSVHHYQYPLFSSLIKQPFIWFNRFYFLNNFKYKVEFKKLKFSKKSIKRDLDSIMKIVNNKIIEINEDLKRYYNYEHGHVKLFFKDGSSIYLNIIDTKILKSKAINEFKDIDEIDYIEYNLDIDTIEGFNKLYEEKRWLEDTYLYHNKMMGTSIGTSNRPNTTTTRT